jgi:hypothetical protein
MQKRTVSWSLGLLAAMAAALPVASQADTMDYTFAELAYVDTKLDNGPFDVDGNGLALRGSLAVNPSFFVFAGYTDLDFDFNVDATQLEVGGGGHLPLAPKIDLVGRAGIVKANIEAGNFDDDDTGLLLGARVRGEIAPRFEVEGGFDYVDLDDFGNDTSIVLEGRYFFVNQWAGGVKVEIGDDSTAISVGARLTF